jgi:hypothetical protein
MAMSEEERILLEQLFHSTNERELNLGTFYYKRVITGESTNPQPLTNDLKKWAMNVEFIALDPIPYNSITGEELY